MIETFNTTDYKVIISNIALDSVSPVLSTQAANGKERVISRNLQYYKGELTITCADLDAVRYVSAFFERNDRSKSFYISLPGYNEPTKRITSTPTISGSYAAGAATVKVSGFTGTITAGDYFTIANDTKVYMALNDAAALDFLNIKPTLRLPITTSAPINVYPKMLVRLVSDTVIYKTQGVTFTRQYDIEFREELL
ncbi:hypothetical protein ACEUA8_01495 [Aeromonas veronii]